ncbi:MAG: phosphoglucomutase [Treponema sp.]|nr:phosphoglucomutase [Treponema sp.]
MILSASGWRKVFAQSGDERDTTTKIGSVNKALCFLAAESFLEWLDARSGSGHKAKAAATLNASKAIKRRLKIVVATDTRPTGKECAEYALKALCLGGADAVFLGVAAAPEIMAFARSFDAFVYISASHNPIGHNGIKFGLDDGGVLNAAQNLEVRAIFERKLNEAGGAEEVLKRADAAKSAAFLKAVSKEKVAANKEASLAAYQKFSRLVSSGTESAAAQKKFFDGLKAALKKSKTIVCADFNGSARTLCINKNFFSECGLKFKAINARPGHIVHEIIPEPENLVHVARFVEETAAKIAESVNCRKAKKAAQKASKTKKAAAFGAFKTPTIIGYMPDCDGDRGNIVYYSKKEGKAKILKAQEVFALSVLSELSFAALRQKADKKAGASNKTARLGKEKRLAVAVNCPTSMRIEEIAAAFGAKVFRAEVGEANVVNLAREKREAGFEVPILGEGSNGGTITYPASVRDPLNTVMALAKFLAVKEAWELWTKARGIPFKSDYTLDDILDSLPKYTTTGVSEKRAILKIKTSDHAVLKKNFQKVFEDSFNKDSEGLLKKYGIVSWKASLTNGTKEKLGATDFSKSQKGGLKILFYENNSKTPASFIWMRGSGTEPVFRIMCDVKGKDAKKEKELLAWETKMLAQADKIR